MLNLSAQRLRIAKNEIYTRHGRRFTDMELQQYFNSCSYQIHSRRYFIKINKHGNIQKGVFMKVKKVLGIIMGILGLVLVIIEILLKMEESMSISVIGGADGPTSIFLAGRIGGNISILIIIVGVILMVIAGFILFKRKH
ncbi:hypothetical protein CLOSTASPAR_00394 [[Clostridium] asparagiforme DSM 15981]|uniref:YARHG domain-containing protein n=3 Tax=Enterocloster asparagiformis TaxID=333367 RepID=C0CTU5_9FIRM|nr:hypothetical protein CLOSTASPAR_00394 [[Clostridium] asparagiforme DSM 15981]